MYLLRTTILLLTISSFSFLYGQAPGYMGKQTFLSFSGSFSPVQKGPTQNNVGWGGFRETSQKPDINYEFSVRLSHAVRRDRTISLDLGQYYTGLTTLAITEPLGIENLPFSVSLEEFDRHELFYRLNAKAISIQSNHFNESKGSLAPMGGFLYYGWKSVLVSGDVIDKATRYGSFEYTKIRDHRNLEINDQVGVHFFSFGWGKNRILFNRLVFSHNFQFSIPLQFGYYEYFFDTKSEYLYDNTYLFQDPVYPVRGNTNDNTALYKAEVITRIARHEFFRFELSLGVLLF